MAALGGECTQIAQLGAPYAEGYGIAWGGVVAALTAPISSGSLGFGFAVSRLARASAARRFLLRGGTS